MIQKNYGTSAIKEILKDFTKMSNGYVWVKNGVSTGDLPHLFLTSSISQTLSSGSLFLLQK